MRHIAPITHGIHAGHSTRRTRSTRVTRIVGIATLVVAAAFTGTGTALAQGSGASAAEQKVDGVMVVMRQQLQLDQREYQRRCPGRPHRRPHHDQRPRRQPGLWWRHSRHPQQQPRLHLRRRRRDGADGSDRHHRQAELHLLPLQGDEHRVGPRRREPEVHQPGLHRRQDLGQLPVSGLGHHPGRGRVHAVPLGRPPLTTAASGRFRRHAPPSATPEIWVMRRVQGEPEFPVPGGGRRGAAVHVAPGAVMHERDRPEVAGRNHQKGFL